MPFPKTKKELIEQGYEFEDKTYCKGCCARIEFWHTPNGKHVPLNSDTLEPHWSTCPHAKDFRK
jgi:hypothetical protein